MPDPNLVHSNVTLANMAGGFPTVGAISEDLFQNTTVQKESDNYMILDPAREKSKDVRVSRAPGTPAERYDFKTSLISYQIEDHAAAAVITDEERANADAPLAPEADKIAFLTATLLIDQEKDAKTQMDTLTGAAVGNGVWSLTTSTPITDIQAGVNRVRLASGFYPTDLVLNITDFQNLQNHPDIIERVVSDGSNEDPANISARGIAALFELERVLVARTSMINNAARGVDTPSMADIWGGTAYVAYRTNAPQPRKTTPTLAYRYGQIVGRTRVNGYEVQRWRDEDIKADVVRVQRYYDQKIVMPEAGTKITGVSS